MILGQDNWLLWGSNFSTETETYKHPLQADSHVCTQRQPTIHSPTHPGTASHHIHSIQHCHKTQTHSLPLRLQSCPAPASSSQLICHIGVRTRTWVSLCSAPFTFLSRSVNLSGLPSLSLCLCLSLSRSGAVSLFSKLCLSVSVSVSDFSAIRFLLIP